MRAGFARVCITPPVGTKMMGFGGRDMERGCDGVHDDIYVRALFLEQGGEQALIMGYDLCFLGREDSDRYKGAIGRVMDLLPRQILLNASHNHVGPSVGTWYSAGYEIPDRDYLDQLERATVRAAREARESSRDVTLSVGSTRSALPMNRRRLMPDGSIQNRPNPGGLVYDRLPICLFRGTDGEPVCLLFSISTHPSMVSGWLISAEYPGAAMDRIDARLGTTAALFLQGVGGDSKPSVIGEGADAWLPGTWELMDKAGAMVADEVMAAVEQGLAPADPALCSGSVEMNWALNPTPPRAFYEEIVAGTAPENRAKNVYFQWAEKTLFRMDRGDTPATSVPLTAHGIQLARDVRMVGIEGEAVGEWGHFIEGFYSGGLTIPLGYTDGQGLYLPTTRMLPEGGYEVISHWEYGLPSGLAPGMEDEVRRALRELEARGIA